MKFTRILALVLALVMCCGMLASCGGGDDNTANKNVLGTNVSASDEFTAGNKVVKIGCSGPLTGPAAVYGLSVEKAAKLAVSEINAIAAEELGFTFQFIMLDDKHDPMLVTNNYASLIEQGVQITLGTVTTGPGLEFKEYSHDDNVFVLTPSASGDDIPEYGNAFQMCFADSNQGTASAQYFNENYVGKKVGIFYKSDDDYSTGIRNKFKAALDKSFTVVEASFKGEEANFQTQVQTLKDCDVIFMPIYYTPASQFMLAGKNTVKANAIYYGCDGLDGIDAVEGFDISTIPQEISYLSHFNSGATEGEAGEFIARYNAFEGDATLNQFGAAAYDCVWAIYEALKFAKAKGTTFGKTTSSSNYCDILSQVLPHEEFQFHGVTGAQTNGGLNKSDISWQKNGFVNKEAVKYIVKEANK